MFPRGPRFPPAKGSLVFLLPGTVPLYSLHIFVTVPEVPGPNSYNLNQGKKIACMKRVHGMRLTPLQESQLDEYKRGAFLEKADRFSEEKASDIPGTCHTPRIVDFNPWWAWKYFTGPGAYNTNTAITTKHAGKPSTQAAMNERYAALLRKLEDLEKIHLEGKKAVSHSYCVYWDGDWLNASARRRVGEG